MKTTRSIAVLVLFLAGCAGAPPATVRPAASATPPPAATATTAPQPTPLPATETLTALPQAQTSIFSHTLPVLPLAEPCQFDDESVAFSPYRTWAIVVCQAVPPADGTITRAVRMDGSAEWDLSFKLAYIQRYKPDDPAMERLLQKAFQPAGWTGDEKYAYLAVQSAAQDSPFTGFDGLFRLDLATGKLTATLMPAIGALATSYAFKFSPGGTQLAYVNQDIRPLSIVLHNTGTGDERRITLDARFSQAGSFVWSPDEKQLVVSVFDKDANGGNSVILFDLAGSKNEYLVKQSRTVYLPLAWVDESRLYAQRYPAGWVYLDTQTKTITPAPAPTPAP